MYRLNIRHRADGGGEGLHTGGSSSSAVGPGDLRPADGNSGNGDCADVVCRSGRGDQRQGGDNERGDAIVGSGVYGDLLWRGVRLATARAHVSGNPGAVFPTDGKVDGVLVPAKIRRGDRGAVDSGANPHGNRAGVVPAGSDAGLAASLAVFGRLKRLAAGGGGIEPGFQGGFV